MQQWYKVERVREDIKKSIYTNETKNLRECTNDAIN